MWWKHPDWLVCNIREGFPEGTRVRAVEMTAIPDGTLGTVTGVDENGTIHIAWDNGSCDGAILGEDVVERVEKE